MVAPMPIFGPFFKLESNFLTAARASEVSSTESSYRWHNFETFISSRHIETFLVPSNVLQSCCSQWRMNIKERRPSIKRKALNNNDHNQVFWARETEHPQQTIFLTKTAGHCCLRSSPPIGLLQLVTTWYKNRHTGRQIANRDICKLSRFVLDVPVPNLRSSMAVFVPCNH